MKLQVKPKSRAQLRALSQPERANQPEALPWVLYDTQTFTQGTTTSLSFFITQQTNASLGNMESAGQLPDPQFFEIYYFGLDIIHILPTKAGATPDLNVIDDTQKLLFGDAGTGADSGRWTYKISNKSYGPFPLSFLHCSGGAVGMGWGTTTADSKNAAYANNGIMDGGFPVSGNLVIPPKMGFSVILEWGGTVALQENKGLRVWMSGVLHRRVL